jgi:hypothetical protein
LGEGRRRFLIGAVVVVLAAAFAVPARAQLTLATGDSMMYVTYRELAFELEQFGADVRSDARIGSGITKEDLLDWRALAAEQARSLRPAVTIVFLGAGDVYPLTVGSVEYAWGTSGWVAAYERRVGAMLRSWLRTGRVYWLTLPTPRDPDLARVFRVNDRAVARAVRRAGPGAEVVDITPSVTRSGRFARKLVVDGKREAVRQLDGVHLAPAGARLAARVVRARLQEDGVLPPG